MRWKIALMAWCMVLSLAAAPNYLVKDGTSQYEIITGNGKGNAFAEKEFRDIMRKGTTVEFHKDCKKKIYIGITPEVEKAIGFERIAQLKEEETLVVEKDGNIYYLGVVNAVRCMQSLIFWKVSGLSLLWTLSGSGNLKRRERIALDGKEISTRPAFSGYR